MSQAINQLLLNRIDGNTDEVVQPNEYDVIEEQGYYLSQY